MAFRFDQAYRHMQIRQDFILESHALLHCTSDYYKMAAFTSTLVNPIQRLSTVDKSQSP